MKIKNCYKLIAFILACALLFSVLNSCKGNDNGEPEFDGVYLTDKGSGDYIYPQIKNIENQDAINASLEEYFSEINEYLEDFNNKYEKLKLSFSLEETELGFILSSQLLTENEKNIHLPNIEIKDQNCILPFIKPQETLKDINILNALYMLASNGMPVSLEELNKPLTVAQFYSLLAIYYESVTGETIDFSAVDRPEIEDVHNLKIIALMPEIIFDNSAEKVKIKDFVSRITYLRKLFNFELYGLASQKMNMVDLENELELLHKMYGIFGASYAEYSTWENLGNDIKAFKNENSDTILNLNALTRLDITDVFSFLFSRYFSLHETGGSDTNLSDTEDADAKYCVANSLMSEFPGGGMFSPDYECRYADLQSITNKFIFTCFNVNFMGEQTAFKDQITLLQAVKCISLINEAYSSYKNNSNESKKTVINDRDYDWYVNQYGTGEYSGVNCMPAMALMAIRWNNFQAAQTVEDLRNRLLSTNNSGWWLAQLADTLSFYGVSYALLPVSLASIVETLDAGGVALTMFSEAKANEQGHCELIYGYKKVGESYKFLVHDPGFENRYKTDGKPYGQSRWIDAEYLVWTAMRINRIYVNVVAPENG